MFIRTKKIGGKDYNYLVESRRVTVKGKSKVKQVVLAYLGQYSNVYDAWVAASGKRRAKLARYLTPEDVNNDAIERAAEREYKRREGIRAMRRAEVKRFLPRLPEEYLPL